jgi:hypothetical protein
VYLVEPRRSAFFELRRGSGALQGGNVEGVGPSGYNPEDYANLKVRATPCSPLAISPRLDEDQESAQILELYPGVVLLREWPRGTGFPQLPSAVTSTVDHPSGSPSPFRVLLHSRGVGRR